MNEAANSRELDEHLREIVQVLHSAVQQGISHLSEPPKVDQAIADCSEILAEVLAGKTAEWLNQDEG